MKRQSPPGGETPTVTVESRTPVFENTRWTVYKDHITGGGLEVKEYLVVAPLVVSGDMVGGVCVAPFMADQSVVMLRNYRHPLDAWFWEGARGFVDPAETPEQAALRELKEETGLECAPEDLIALGAIAPEPSTIVARIALFAALNCRPTATPVADELGLGKTHTFPLTEAVGMVRRGEIEDSTSQLAYLRSFISLGSI